MELLASVARFEILLILALLFGVVLFQALSGRIQVNGILRSKVSGDLDAGRLQLLVPTLLLAGQMLVSLSEMRQRHEVFLPSQPLLYLFGGSHAVYLIRKYLQHHPRPREE